ncbi:hypothetical protein PV328_005680 [Microctonus aethiopoides]|uniref:Large ribosomal subunit protein mL46 n=1 Tax=Microctonus aethiopoides TaxID=144406 RepID=A0AA39FMS5_9HYME|nr:hypothetical protein PV328_005680 [Microctonus aethiopoides]
MLKQSLKLCTTTSINVLSPFLRHQMCSISSATKPKWDLLSAVCVERHPLITSVKTDLEEAYQNMLNQIEFENSMKSDHELNIEMERKQREKLKKGLVEIDAEKITEQKAEDLEELADEEMASFKFAPRITEADRNNITTSLERKLDKCLLLLVQQKIGNDSFWLPPQGIRNDGETMRQTAERVLLNTCGDMLQAKIYGNAPIGFYKWKYPKSIRDHGTEGAKVFFYLAKYMNGTVADTVKYQWLDRPELEKNIPVPIYKSMSQFLIPEQTN